jgi:hypothetical protein
MVSSTEKNDRPVTEKVSPMDTANVDNYDNTSSSSSPFINSLLKYMTLVGLGMILGYGLFYSMFHLLYANVMEEMEKSYNVTVEVLNNKYLKAVEDLKLCMEEDNQNKEIYDLRGRLEAQSDVVASYRELLDKHKVSQGRLNDINAELERKEAELYVLKKRIEIHDNERMELEEELDATKQLMATTLGEQTEEINSLRSSIQAFQSAETEMLEHVQHRYSAMCRQL